MTQDSDAARTTSAAILKAMRALGDPTVASHSQRFFRTGKGDYGEGDRFLGIRIPVVRQQVRRYRHASLRTLTSLLRSPWHEVSVRNDAWRYRRTCCRTTGMRIPRNRSPSP